MPSPPNESRSPSAICAALSRRSGRKASSPKSTPRSTGTSSSAPSLGLRKGPGMPAKDSFMFQARTDAISAERKPVAFGDLRGFIEALRAQGELAEIDAEVDWNIELGTVMRLAQGPGTGKALIFNNIKDY